MLASLWLSDTLPQLSLAVGVPNTGVLGHSMVVEASVDVQPGAMVSTTEISCDVVVVRPPQPSDAVHERTTT